MSWLITPQQLLVDDQDALTYLAAVEAADGQALETATRMAINSFVKGCKNDGIWPAIKASCILAGARTRLGALTPLVGTAPTSFNFVDGDYNRKTGLVGNGSTKYLDSNRSDTADPQNNFHMAVSITSLTSGNYATYIGATNTAGTASSAIRNNINSTASEFLARGSTGAGVSRATGFNAVTRFNSSTIERRAGGISDSVTNASVAVNANNIHVFADNYPATTPRLYSNARLAFYSIGESLNLALLDTRVTTLVNALSAAIP